jgi:hypothetical protein
MASFQDALICALLALLFWTGIGFPLARQLASRSLALAIAPAMGWAIQSVIALPVFSIFGMSRLTVIAVNLAMISAAAVATCLCERGERKPLTPSLLPFIACIAATVLALSMMMAILPKGAGEGIILSAPIFDHSKIAMVDEMVRSGVPPANPFFGDTGGLSHLAYYYLWHFSAAELAIVTGFSGWNADAAMTGFTAFASLALMMGFAVWLSGRRAAAILVVVLAATESARPVLGWLIGKDAVASLIGKQSGFAGWLFQATWATQHAASALCVVLGIFLVTCLMRRPTWLTAILLGLIAAAGFESSTWVGGLVFPLAAVAVVTSVLFTQDNASHWRIAGLGLAAAILAFVLVSPFLYDQYLSAMARGTGSLIAIAPYKALGVAIPGSLRSVLDLPAYWLVFLVVQFPAFYLAGTIMAAAFLKDRTIDRERRQVLSAFMLLGIVSLAISWLFTSTIGENNDLGWRAALPAILLLIIFAAAGLVRYRPPRFFGRALAAAGIVVGLVEGALLIQGYVDDDVKPSAVLFARSVSMWQAVRTHSDIDERVANNPAFLGDMTPWSVNISWALLADRRSCYAGSELALPFAPLSRQRKQDVDAQFARVFAGTPEEGDIEQLATRYHCDLAVVTAQDGAWTQDPFAASQFYHLVENSPGAWRIYKITLLANN